jgi:hypothetical protein
VPCGARTAREFFRRSMDMAVGPAFLKFARVF